MIDFQSQRGFTLLLAALIASLMMALGVAMFTIAQKQVRLSSVARDSQFAFYAADAGAECALFLHYTYDAFATSTTFTDTDKTKCDEQQLIGGVGQPTYLGGGYTTTFKYDLRGDGGREYCVSVRVVKNSSYPNTQINSLGYSASCSERALSNRTLERAVRMDL